MPSPVRVLITGANKGIGLATVRSVLEAREDAFVLLGARSPERGARALETLLEEEPGYKDRVELITIDVGSDESVREAAAEVRDRFKPESRPLYGLINNAGIGFGSTSFAQVLDINTLGPRRVCEAFVPLLDPAGRIVNVSSASGPNFVANCSADRQRQLTSPNVTWDDVEKLIQEAMAAAEGDGNFEALGLGDGAAYGLSKACLNAYTIDLARRFPEMTINACTPGFIETDLTRHYLKGSTASEVGMKSPSEGTKAQLHLLFGQVGGSGWYFGSDAQRSPLDRYRSPGDPPYVPEDG